MTTILSRCLSGDFPDCRELAGICEVSRRTILRDIVFLRDRLIAPLEYDPSRRGYCLTGDFNLMPRLDLGDEDVFTLHFIRQALAPYEGTKTGEVMMKSFNRMVTLLLGANAWKKVNEAGDLSRAASSFRAGASTSASQ
jgi:predicted DNA-binding transcriptional regulator YafY